MTQDSRYLTDAALDEFLASGPTAAFRIPGVPEVHLVFLPGAAGGVALRVAWDGAAVPELSEYEHLSASVVRAGKQAWAELLIDDPDVFRRALPVVWRIADRIQLERLSFAEAVVVTLADFRELLESASVLSSDREVGLFGELTVVDCLISTLGSPQAIAAWRGPDGDEHDFDLGSGDLEVKSTLSEKRVHWIGSLSQLEPTPDRPLWLLSMQLTTGLGDALTVADLVAELRARLAGADLAAFEGKLYSAGWRDKYGTTMRRRFRMRSKPLLLPVDAEFPALTQDRVAAAGMPLARLREIAYSIDVAGLNEELCPPPALGQLVAKGGTW
jgi:Putative  PD-(D/E)XK family member, (DUF4420)